MVIKVKTCVKGGYNDTKSKHNCVKLDRVLVKKNRCMKVDRMKLR